MTAQGASPAIFLRAVLGVDWLDAELLGELEGRSVIEQVASDLCNMFDERTNAAVEWGRYPPW